MIKLVALIVPMGLDSFLVAAALAMSGLTRAEQRRIALTFPLFETLMPVLGLGVGLSLGSAVGRTADFLAAGLILALALLGGSEEDESSGLRSATGSALVIAGLAVSVDELGVGVAVGLLGLNPLLALAFIALQAVFLSQLGLAVGDRFGSAFRERAQIAHMLALVCVGVFLLLMAVTDPADGQAVNFESSPTAPNAGSSSAARPSTLRANSSSPNFPNRARSRQSLLPRCDHRHGGREDHLPAEFAVAVRQVRPGLGREAGHGRRGQDLGGGPAVAPPNGFMLPNAQGHHSPIQQSSGSHLASDPLIASW